MAAPGASRSVQLRGVVDVCALVDEMAPEEIGQLVAGGDHGSGPEGAVFVEGGRVCWAGARGLGRRLSTLLAESAGIDGRRMEELYLTCRRDHTPLGEYMVKHGLVAADTLRRALLQHTVESLRALCADTMRAVWMPRRGGYHPAFTFTTAEILASVFSTDHGGRPSSLEAELASVFVEGEWSAAFLRSRNSSAPDPVALFGAFPPMATTILRVGKWAASALDLASALQDEDAFLATMTPRGALVAWCHADAIIAGETSNFGPARILNRRARLRAGGESKHGHL